MLNIKIDDAELEEFLKNEFNGRENELVAKFIEYIKLQRIRNDVKISLEELENGKGSDIEAVFSTLKAKYANK